MQTSTEAKPKKLTAPDTQIRSMWPTDLRQVLLIAEKCFGAEAWGKEDFTICFPTRTNYFGYVAEMAGRLVGFAVSRIINKYTVKIENIGVLPDFRLFGVGRLLVERVERSNTQPKRLRTLVRESNLGAQLFFQAIGWRATGMDPRPWSGIEEDGILFFKRVLRGRS